VIVLFAMPVAAVAGIEATTLGTRFGFTKLALVVVTGIAAMFAASQTRASIPLLLITIPFILKTDQLLDVDIHVSHGVQVVIVLQLLAGLYARRLAIPRGLGMPLGLIALGGVIGAIAGPDIGGSMVRCAVVLVPVLLLAVAAASSVDLERDLPWIIIASAVGLIGTGLLGFYQRGGGSLPGPVFTDDRIAGLFYHPNDLGGYAAVSVVLLAGVAAHIGRRFALAPFMLIVPIAAGIPTLAFTGSRSALVALAVGVTVLVLLSLANRQIAAFFMILLTAVVVVSIAVPRIPATQREAFLARVQNTSTADDFGREEIFKVAVRTIGEYPLTGVGPFAFGSIMQQAQEAASFQSGAVHAHNLYLEGFLSVGPIGMIGFIWLCGGALTRLWSARPSRAGPRRALTSGWALGSIAALAVLAAQGVVEFVFTQTELLMLCFLILGLAYAIPAQDQEEPDPRPALV